MYCSLQSTHKDTGMLWQYHPSVACSYNLDACNMFKTHVMISNIASAWKEKSVNMSMLQASPLKMLLRALWTTYCRAASKFTKHSH